MWRSIAEKHPSLVNVSKFSTRPSGAMQPRCVGPCPPARPAHAPEQTADGLAAVGVPAGATAQGRSRNEDTDSTGAGPMTAFNRADDRVQKAV